jgi:replicative DNA helicase
MTGAFQATEAERSVIGALMLENGAIDEVRDLLKQEDFTQDANRRAYAAICALAEAKTPIDEVTVLAALKTQPGASDDEAMLLSELTGNTPTAANVRAYAVQVANASRLRRLAAEAHAVAQECMEATLAGEADALNFFAEMQTRLVNASTFGSSKHLSTTEVIRKVMRFAEDRKRSRGAMLGFTTGFDGVDHLISGLRKKRQHVIAARSGAGKTAIALNVLRNASAAGARSFVVSYEMGAEELGLRVLSAESRVPIAAIETGNIDDGNNARLFRASDDLLRSNIVWTDNPPATIPALRAEMQQLKRRGGLDLLIVDYLQLMSGTGKKGSNREQEVAEVSRGLKKIAVDFDVAVIALSQLNRNKARNEEPDTSDLRESGAIEQDADVVIFLWAQDDKSDVVNWKIAKNRGGKTEAGTLRFRKHIQHFQETL